MKQSNSSTKIQGLLHHTASRLFEAHKKSFVSKWACDGSIRDKIIDISNKQQLTMNSFFGRHFFTFFFPLKFSQIFIYTDSLMLHGKTNYHHRRHFVALLFKIKRSICASSIWADLYIKVNYNLKCTKITLSY